MASGWSSDGAVQDQIDSTLQDAVWRARDALPKGAESLSFCEGCGDAIPDARRAILPGVRLCITCQQKEDAHIKTFSGYNRRGSKNSQLR